MASAGLRRPLHPIPEDVAGALEREGLTKEYGERPPYQRNDYVGWITKAKLSQTREKRIRQMLDELRGGRKYMGMDWRRR